MKPTHGIRKLNEYTIDKDLALIITETDKDNYYWNDIPNGSLLVNPNTGMLSMKLEGESNWVPVGMKKDGTEKLVKDATIGVEYYTIVKFEEDLNRFYYHDVNEIVRIGKLVDGKAQFKIGNGLYLPGLNHLEVLINDSVRRTVQDGTLDELNMRYFQIDRDDIRLGSTVTVKYINYERLSELYPFFYIQNKTPWFFEDKDIWIDTTEKTADGTLLSTPLSYSVNYPDDDTEHAELVVFTTKGSHLIAHYRETEFFNGYTERNITKFKVDRKPHDYYLNLFSTYSGYDTAFNKILIKSNVEKARITLDVKEENLSPTKSQVTADTQLGNVLIFKRGDKTIRKQQKIGTPITLTFDREDDDYDITIHAQNKAIDKELVKTVTIPMKEIINYLNLVLNTDNDGTDVSIETLPGSTITIIDSDKNEMLNAIVDDSGRISTHIDLDAKPDHYYVKSVHPKAKNISEANFDVNLHKPSAKLAAFIEYNIDKTLAMITADGEPGSTLNFSDDTGKPLGQFTVGDDNRMVGTLEYPTDLDTPHIITVKATKKDKLDEEIQITVDQQPIHKPKLPLILLINYNEDKSIAYVKVKAEQQSNIVLNVSGNDHQYTTNDNGEMNGVLEIETQYDTRLTVTATATKKGKEDEKIYGYINPRPYHIATPSLAVTTSYNDDTSKATLKIQSEPGSLVTVGDHSEIVDANKIVIFDNFDTSYDEEVELTVTSTKIGKYPETLKIKLRIRPPHKGNPKLKVTRMTAGAENEYDTTDIYTVESEVGSTITFTDSTTNTVLKTYTQSNDVETVSVNRVEDFDKAVKQHAVNITSVKEHKVDESTNTTIGVSQLQYRLEIIDREAVNPYASYSLREGGSNGLDVIKFKITNLATNQEIKFSELPSDATISLRYIDRSGKYNYNTITDFIDYKSVESKINNPLLPKIFDMKFKDVEDNGYIEKLKKNYKYINLTGEGVDPYTINDYSLLKETVLDFNRVFQEGTWPNLTYGFMLDDRIFSSSVVDKDNNLLYVLVDNSCFRMLELEVSLTVIINGNGITSNFDPVVLNYFNFDTVNVETLEGASNVLLTSSKYSLDILQESNIDALRNNSSFLYNGGDPNSDKLLIKKNLGLYFPEDLNTVKIYNKIKYICPHLNINVSASADLQRFLSDEVKNNTSNTFIDKNMYVFPSLKQLANELHTTATNTVLNSFATDYGTCEGKFIVVFGNEKILTWVNESINNVANPIFNIEKEKDIEQRNLSFGDKRSWTGMNSLYVFPNLLYVPSNFLGNGRSLNKNYLPNTRSKQHSYFSVYSPFVSYIEDHALTLNHGVLYSFYNRFLYLGEEAFYTNQVDTASNYSKNNPMDFINASENGLSLLAKFDNTHTILFDITEYFGFNLGYHYDYGGLLHFSAIINTEADNNKFSYYCTNIDQLKSKYKIINEDNFKKAHPNLIKDGNIDIAPAKVNDQALFLTRKGCLPPKGSSIFAIDFNTYRQTLHQDQDDVILSYVDHVLESSVVKYKRTPGIVYMRLDFLAGSSVASVRFAQDMPVCFVNSKGEPILNPDKINDGYVKVLDKTVFSNSVIPDGPFSNCLQLKAIRLVHPVNLAFYPKLFNNTINLERLDVLTNYLLDFTPINFNSDGYRNKTNRLNVTLKEGSNLNLHMAIMTFCNSSINNNAESVFMSPLMYHFLPKRYLNEGNQQRITLGAGPGTGTTFSDVFNNLPLPIERLKVFWGLHVLGKHINYKDNTDLTTIDYFNSHLSKFGTDLEGRYTRKKYNYNTYFQAFGENEEESIDFLKCLQYDPITNTGGCCDSLSWRGIDYTTTSDVDDDPMLYTNIYAYHIVDMATDTSNDELLAKPFQNIEFLEGSFIFNQSTIYMNSTNTLRAMSMLAPRDESFSYGSWTITLDKPGPSKNNVFDIYRETKNQIILYCKKIISNYTPNVHVYWYEMGNNGLDQNLIYDAASIMIDYPDNYRNYKANSKFNILILPRIQTRINQQYKDSITYDVNPVESYSSRLGHSDTTAKNDSYYELYANYVGINSYLPGYSKYNQGFYTAAYPITADHIATSIGIEKDGHQFSIFSPTSFDRVNSKNMKIVSMGIPFNLFPPKKSDGSKLTLEDINVETLTIDVDLKKMRRILDVDYLVYGFLESFVDKDVYKKYRWPALKKIIIRYPSEIKGYFDVIKNNNPETYTVVPIELQEVEF